MITPIYAACAGLFLVFLSIRVIKVRRSEKISVGTANHPDLERAARVHANFLEYTPLLLLMLYFAEVGGLPSLFVHLLGATLIGSRFAHFMGFKSPEAPMILRVSGMMVTFTLLACLALILILQSVGAL